MLIWTTLGHFWTILGTFGRLFSHVSQPPIIIIIIITRPKPPYGRQGLAGLWGRDTVRWVYFGVISTSHLVPMALSLDEQPLTSMAFKDFCNNTSEFLQQRFSIFATFFLHFCNKFHLHWGSTDPLWLKKRDVTEGPNWPPLVQNNVTLQTQGPNWPPPVQKNVKLRTWGPTDLLDV